LKGATSRTFATLPTPNATLHRLIANPEDFAIDSFSFECFGDFG
jgi:hypothetical protein